MQVKRSVVAIARAITVPRGAPEPCACGAQRATGSLHPRRAFARLPMSKATRFFTAVRGRAKGAGDSRSMGMPNVHAHHSCNSLDFFETDFYTRVNPIKGNP
ncbi:hypothetical protein KQH60_06085 [Mycetohabitans sp. B8]|uniref:hypothetical protein n=1 Tax=Mycetohabitans sp. B8 TaxID=2841845 RepID=UPI001F47015F|nr:hypothetical protein [Mycetohabitans sp. B8]MCG1042148.1 hypothetical protein [Mycetohabitans sp. B8]